MGMAGVLLSNSVTATFIGRFWALWIVTMPVNVNLMLA